jgi:hypothetical protein
MSAYVAEEKVDKEPGNAWGGPDWKLLTINRRPLDGNHTPRRASLEPCLSGLIRPL